MLLLLIITKILSGYSFLIGYGLISILKNMVVIICGLTLLLSKNHISLHDKLSNSQVIEDVKKKLVL